MGLEKNRNPGGWGADGADGGQIGVWDSGDFREPTTRRSLEIRDIKEQEISRSSIINTFLQFK